MKKLGFILLIVMFIILMPSGGRLGVYVDFQSIIFVLGIALALLLATKNHSHFIKAFKVLSGYAFTNQELQHAISAIELAIKGLIASGIIGFIFGLINVLLNLPDLSKLGPYLAISLLTLFYAFILSVFLLIINYQLIGVRNERTSEE